MAATRDGQAPTIENARAAAHALAGEGVPSVLVFGSVARGDAKPGSDIDLVALFDDIDYGQRRQIKRRLRDRATAAAGVECGIVVTDLPEWHGRVDNVSSSFEHAISKEAVPLVGGSCNGHVNWDKPQVKPMNNTDQTLYFLDNIVLPRLARLASDMFQRSWEETHLPLREAEVVRQDRMRSLCEDAAMTVELSLKTMITLKGEHPITEKEMRQAGHNVDACLQKLDATRKHRFDRTVRQFGLDLALMSEWRNIATYPDEIDDERADADLWADYYALTALVVAKAAVEEIEHNIGVTHYTAKAHGRLDRMIDRFQTHDVHTCERREERDLTKQATNRR